MESRGQAGAQAPEISEPRSECARAVSILSSTKRPMLHTPSQSVGSLKFTTRLLAVRPDHSLASRRAAAFDQHRLHTADHSLIDRALIGVELDLQPVQAGKL